MITEPAMPDSQKPAPEPMRAALAALQAPDATVTVHVGARAVVVPENAVEHLRAILARLAEGQRVRVVDDDPELTTQQAADLLNLSRPHFVRLLEAGKLSFHAVGTHRRVLIADVLAYKAARSAKREAAFRLLADEAQKHGLGA